MAARRLIGYGDALVLLGGDPAGLAALDEALGSALGLATGGASETVLNLVGAQGRILRLGRDLVATVRERLGTADRASRSERLAAAHAVLVVTAYFEELAAADLPFDWAEARLTRREQLALAGGPATAARDFVHALTAAAPPMPAPHVPPEQVRGDLGFWYLRLSGRLERFLRGLALWDGMNHAQRERTRETLRNTATAALDRYEELYARLAGDVPEFAFWTHRTEHQATRAAVREALTGVETLLAGLSAAAAPVDVAAALATAYRAALDRLILPEGDTLTGVGLPRLADGYFDPRFRVRAVDGGPGVGGPGAGGPGVGGPGAGGPGVGGPGAGGPGVGGPGAGGDGDGDGDGQGSGPADESWWAGVGARDDLSEYLAGAFTGPGAATAPLVVLGQPGAGKSLLTTVLAARLSAGGFLPVRVVLRDVPAEAGVQDQIEYAIRAATGERATWPDLVRAAPGLVPVVLFDGFDELLQATGVSQSDFLERVAAFQRREADQGRPVVALVTTRTAVADRARYPEGSVVLRLEPFGDDQIAAWIALWNRVNEWYFPAWNLRPLPADLAARHRDLAAQPLLLLMLALYDATENGLQRDGDDPLDEADLYEELLTAFAAREVGKSVVAPRPGEVAARVQQELERLSLVAFAMLNRRRQWVTADELAVDLAALLGRGARPESGFRAPLDQAEIALGRFFFVQRAQAVRDARHLATYEFLHATFGEYLAVRLAVNVLHGLLDRPPALLVSGDDAPVADDLLYALLSYVPLSSRQMLRFVRARLARVPSGEHARLADLVVAMRAAAAFRTRHDHAGYRPDPDRPTTSRHGLYEANLVLLLLALTGGFPASRLFPESDDPPGTWHRRALLWRSAFTETEWTDFALSLRLRHTWAGERRELLVEPAAGQRAPEPVNLDWVFRRGPDAGARTDGWQRAHWADLPHKSDVSGGTNDAVVQHAMEPVFATLGMEVMTFTGGEPATSVAHDLLRLCLSPAWELGPDGLAALYRRCADWLRPRGHRLPAHKLLLDRLAADAERLPPELVADLLLLLLETGGGRADNRALLPIAAKAFLNDPSPESRPHLRLVIDSAAAGSLGDDPHAWQAWVTLHDHGLAGEAFIVRPANLLGDCNLGALPSTLGHAIERVAATHYPGVNFPYRA
ncbi:NACHT domain-containing NTPase [Streptomyces sp. HPF1205]|uniref:NACHT domain-containing protein n=1 Tax=Streptomyces sp. HPF1205 TaxID=2873262 RepID=UPI001CEC6921|nr:hypothetical protein [Streptomyces sp. HPF1205]